MAGNNSTLAGQALEDMMADLGNDRMEELAAETDHDSVLYGRPPLRDNFVKDGALQLCRSEPHREGVKNWKIAIEEKCFDDDDAAGVKGLDTLDGGNAHRMKLGPPLTSTVLPSQGVRIHQLRYNPSQPTYGRRPRQDIHRPSPSPQNYQTGQLGGIVPEGGVVKIWHSGRRADEAGTADKTMVGLRASSQPMPSQPMPSQPMPTHQKSAQQEPAQQKLAQQEPAQQKLAQQEPAQQKLAQQKPTRKRSRKSKSIQHTSNPGRSSVQPAQTANAYHEHVVPVSNPPHTAIGSQTAPTRPQVVLESEIDFQQASLRPSQVSVEVGTVTAYKSRQVFFLENVLVPDAVASNTRLSSRIIVYEFETQPICVCELTINEDEVITVDIRSLLPLSVDGRRVILRRNNPNGKSLLINTLFFEDLRKAASFQKEAQRCIIHFKSFSVDIFVETSTKLKPAHDVAAQREADNPADLAGRQLHAPTIEQTRLQESGNDALELEGPVPESGERETQRKDSSTPPAIEETEPSISEVVDVSTRSNDPAIDDLVEDLIDWRISSPKNTLKPFSLPFIGPHEAKRLDKQWLSAFRSVANKQLANSEATEPTDALGDFQVMIDVRNSKDLSRESRQLIHGITSADYGDMVKVSDDLAVALNNASLSPAAFIASALHLMEKDEFLQLSWDHKIESMAVVYSNVCRQNSRIIRTPEEILALQPLQQGARPGAILYHPSGDDLQPQKRRLTATGPQSETGTETKKRCLSATSPEFYMPAGSSLMPSATYSGRPLTEAPRSLGFQVEPRTELSTEPACSKQLATARGKSSPQLEVQGLGKC